MIWWVAGSGLALAAIAFVLLRTFSHDADLGTLSGDWLARQRLGRGSADHWL